MNTPRSVLHNLSSGMEPNAGSTSTIAARSTAVGAFRISVYPCSSFETCVLPLVATPLSPLQPKINKQTCLSVGFLRNLSVCSFPSRSRPLGDFVGGVQEAPPSRLLAHHGTPSLAPVGVVCVGCRTPSCRVTSCQTHLLGVDLASVQQQCRITSSNRPCSQIYTMVCSSGTIFSYKKARYT